MKSEALIQGLGLFNPLMRELAEMLYEFEEPFIVDHTPSRGSPGPLELVPRAF